MQRMTLPLPAERPGFLIREPARFERLLAAVDQCERAPWS